VLAEFVGAGPAVAAWTNKAMGGDVPFQDALAARLELIQPSTEKVAELMAQRNTDEVLTPGIRELVALLLRKGKQVFLVSGGFRFMINPVAKELGIPEENVFANTILYDEAGQFAGFDSNEFTSQAGGKANAVAHIKATRGFGTVVMVGDGATDAEAKAASGEGAALFVGFGGIARRAKVEALADWYLLSFQPLVELLEGM